MKTNLMQQSELVVDLHIKAKPRAKANELLIKGDEILVKITASPVDHAANEAILVFLAKILERPKSSLCLLKGQSNAHKTIRINGLTLNEIKEKIGLV